MDLQHFERINAFIEDRLRPLFDADSGNEHGWAMDDTSRSLRALRDIALSAAAVKGIAEQQETGSEDVRRIAGQALAHQWDLLVRIARHWEDHPDFRREFKRGSWEFDLAAAAPGAAD
ncbi:hypothetical protein [Streptomyces sp. NPDC018031]|uniref:hypothetical protein n=1 Tax=Streptomyces sp. NPDC018031 TaxID=3365033 RepID=UPI0037ADD918